MLFLGLELQPGSYSVNSSDLASCYLFPYSFELIFQDCLKTSQPGHHAMLGSKAHHVFGSLSLVPIDNRRVPLERSRSRHNGGISSK